MGLTAQTPENRNKVLLEEKKGTNCAKSVLIGLPLRTLFSPAQPRSIFFHPPDPPIALQSITRDAPFSQEHRL